MTTTANVIAPVLQPTLSSSPVEATTPKRMLIKKWIIIIMATLRIKSFCTLIYVYSKYSKEIHLFYYYLICLSAEGVGLLGAVGENVCIIGFYIGHNIVYCGFNLLVSLKSHAIADGFPVGLLVIAILYIWLLCSFWRDCNTVQKTKRQQQEGQENVV